MSGLVLALAPSEKFIVNGALLQNGEKHSRIRVKDGDARVLRCADALHPHDVNTPVKQVYYALQLIITGDLEEELSLPAIHRECDALVQVFESIGPKLITTVQDMIRNGNYYSALCALKSIITVEANLLAVAKDAKIAQVA